MASIGEDVLSPYVTSHVRTDCYGELGKAPFLKKGSGRVGLGGESEGNCDLNVK